ncbi:MAG: NAD(+)/NADH kinase [Candidatus Eisenbacteria bacterium]|nr:NAD(+)/NADH kinase [Candidatus Eisenbacteria bacterium]
MKPKKPSRVALVVNTRRTNSRKVALDAIKWLETRGVHVFLEKSLGTFLKRPDLSSDESVLRKEAQVVLAIGGDGTILRAAKAVRGTRAVVLGVNLGSLGFLSDIKLCDLYPALERIMKGDYEVERRMMVEARVEDFRKSIHSYEALNDIVICKTASSRALRMRLLVSGRLLGKFTADGLIVSTPTGSTAYSLSAGGPIMKPTMSALLATPICAHSLAARPLVVPGEETLTVELAPRDTTAKLIADGHESFDLHPHHIVRFHKARVCANLVSARGVSFYDVLREKFKWGGVPARDARGN